MFSLQLIKTMNIKVLLLQTLVFFSYQLAAQITSESNIVGSNIQIQSKVLNQEREIQVYLPDGYEESEKSFPVLYLLDGQRYFLHGVSLLKSLPNDISCMG